jgi:hypothetical protein
MPRSRQIILGLRPLLRQILWSLLLLSSADDQQLGGQHPEARRPIKQTPRVLQISLTTNPPYKEQSQIQAHVDLLLVHLTLQSTLKLQRPHSRRHS